MEKLIERIYSYPLEEIMGERFGRYSKEIIQDRAIPDARDGLKPVQRRIIYGMYLDHNTHDQKYRKCAKTVGNVMGNYHPHGDSSIYEALVRMSQWWKQNECPIDMQGNNGSMDGDGAAAMRYTEARLSKIAGELVKDIKKNTVDMTPTFDDTDLEPTVLPSRFPNLLVNGATGISAGYATNIPPHNLGEIIDAVMKRIDSPNCRFESIMDLVKGPDFPTGAIVEGKDGIKEAYQTGRGRVVVRARHHIEEEKKLNRIVIDEIPFDVNKMLGIVKKTQDIRLDKKIDGILDVRDESAEKVRIAIDIKKEVDPNFILAYLYKNTDLQITYNYNMVAIVNRRPMTLGILPLLDAYIAHQKEVVTRRTQYDLETTKARKHIVDGLIRALSILDEIIKVIRASKNRSDAVSNLVKEFDFTELQADAIVRLRLYKLTNTDVTELEAELKKLDLDIKVFEAILKDEEKLKYVIKTELKAIKKEYATPRKTEIKDAISEFKIEKTQMLPKEDVVVLVTNEGYIKRVSERVYAANTEAPMVKVGDFVTGIYKMNTMDTLLLFTSLGNYLYLPVHEIPELKWKDLGKHISNIIPIKAGEEIVSTIPIYDFDGDDVITTYTKGGMIKRSSVGDFRVQRYSKPMVCMKLKGDDTLLGATKSRKKEVFVSTRQGYGLWFDVDCVPITGVKASGVKAINLKNDTVCSVNFFNGESEYLALITEKHTAKRVKLTEFDKTTRAKRGVRIVREVKTNPYYIEKTFTVDSHSVLTLLMNDGMKNIKITELSIADRYSTGSALKDSFTNIFEEVVMKEKEDDQAQEEVSIKPSNVSLKEIDEKMMTIDDFLDDFNKD